MTEVAPNAVHLAALRASGSIRPPVAPSVVAELHAAAARAGRRIIDAGRPGNPLLTLGWLEGSEPVAGPDTGVERNAATPVLLLTFAACLRCCWTDPHSHPWPGGQASEEQVLAAMAAVGQLSRTGEGSAPHQKGAIRRLRAAGLLDARIDAIRLGPQVAAWTDTQLDRLRAVYDRLPAPPDPAGGHQ